MQDLKRNRKRVSSHNREQIEDKCLVQEDILQEIDDNLSRACGCNQSSTCNQSVKCDCACYPSQHNNCCDPCEVDSNQCVDNTTKCGPSCMGPIVPQRFNVSNSVPYAIEANRIFDTMLFQTFTDATAQNGAPLGFECEVVEVNGPVPRVGQVNVKIEEVCMNYSGIVIDTGNTTLEDYEIDPIDPIVGNSCENSFEYSVCGEKNLKYAKRGKGKSVVYKERGLSVLVEDLVLELKGKCGCTEIVAYAYPAVKCSGCQSNRCSDVEFLFNTLSAPVGLPADGRSAILRQDFQTNLTVDCIGKALLSYIDLDGCDGDYELNIPNDIDLILCLECVVSVLINEQIVVLGSPNPLDPRVVDTFSKVCDFKKPRENN